MIRPSPAHGTRGFMSKNNNTKKIGFVLIVVGLAVNRATISLIWKDAELTYFDGVLIFFAFQSVLLLAGGYLVLAPASKASRIAFNGALVVVSLMFSASCFEFALRLDPGFHRLLPVTHTYVGDFENRESRNFLADPRIGWRMRPNIRFNWIIEGRQLPYVANRQGFRSDFDFEAEPGRRVIALVGDSFTFGTGVAVGNTYGALLDRRIGSGVRVYNYAQPGFGIDQMWMSVRHLALAVKPLLIVVGFVDRDLDRSLNAYRPAEGFNKPTFVRDDGTLRPQRISDRPHPVLRDLTANSAIWRLGRLLFRQLGMRFGIGEWWLRNRAIFEAIKADAERAGVPVLLLRIPLKKPDAFPVLARFAREAGMPLLDLGSPSVARPSEPIHFRRDHHINDAGHRFVYEKLYRWIRDRRLLPDSP